MTNNLPPDEFLAHIFITGEDSWQMSKCCFAAKSTFAGGNPVCPRPTPIWQKGIGDFFGGPSRKPDKENHLPQSDDEEAGVSGVSKSSRKYVHSIKHSFRTSLKGASKCLPL